MTEIANGTHDYNYKCQCYRCKGIRSKMKQQVKMIPLALIKNKFDVRVALNDDRVLQFAGMYEDEARGLGEVPPVELVELADGAFAIKDGRHRVSSRDFLGLSDVPAVIVPIGDIGQMFAEALKANYGGAMTPTRQDIIHTVTRMFENGSTQTQVRELLSFLPSGSLRIYIQSARTNIIKRKYNEAVKRLGEGATIDEAARATGLTVKGIQDKLNGERAKWGKDRSESLEYATSVKAYVSSQLKSVHNGIAKKLQDLLVKVNDGDVTYIDASGVIKAFRDHAAHTRTRIEDWQARLDGLETEFKKAAGVKLIGPGE